MNYLKTYCSLIRKAENRDCPEGYVEKHHIFPVVSGKRKTHKGWTGLIINRKND